MDALAVGALTALGTVTGMLLWVLLVRPDALLGLLVEDAQPAWFMERPGSLRGLRWIGAGLVLFVGFVTGAVVAFLAATS